MDAIDLIEVAFCGEEHPNPTNLFLPGQPDLIPVALMTLFGPYLTIPMIISSISI
jgi:hypothetical protein